jgi:hypothetical protein
MYKILSTALIALAASGVSLLLAAPSQAQIQITGGNIRGSLNFEVTNNPPDVVLTGGGSPNPEFTLRSVDVRSLTLNLAGGGSIQNFEGAATLTGASIQGTLPNGLAQVGTSGSFSGVVTGRSLLTTGQFLAFSNTPINLQAVVTNGTISYINKTSGFGGTYLAYATQTGTLNVLGGSIQSNAKLTSGSIGNAVISNDGASAIEVANNPEIQARIANNANVVRRVGSTGIGVVQGPPSRVFSMQ